MGQALKEGPAGRDGGPPRSSGTRVDADTERTSASARGTTPFYFGPPSRQLFAWYHPVGGRSRGAGIVLCNTLGNESLRAYGTLRHLAEDLAEAGFAVLRFDFHGTGDSGGSEGDPGRLASWLEDIDLAIEELRARSGLREIGIAGLRLGGTLALLAAARRGDMESIVLWDPYYDGRDFVSETSRMHRALAMLEPASFALKRPEGSGQGGVEALGFFLSDATVAELGTIDLLSVGKCPARKVLVVGSAAAQKRKGDALIGRLRTLGGEPEYEVLPEHMNRNLRLVSARDHEWIAADITRWMAHHLGVSDRAGDPTAASPRAVAQHSDVGETQKEIDEEPIFFGERDVLFGIVSRPETRREGERHPAIILINAGPGTRIGPHRQYVRMARTWAKLGFLVLRMDLSGSGDSAAVAGTAESDPYPRQAVRDVQTAMNVLNRRFSVSRFVVAGVCSGADIAFRVAVEEPRVVGALILNPRTFAVYNIPNLEQLVRAHYLGATVTAKKNWRMLLRGEAGLKGTLIRISQISRTAAVSMKQKMQSVLGRGDSPTAAVDVPAYVRGLVKRAVDTLLVVGERDVGILYVEASFRDEMLALEGMRRFRRVNFTGIDHLFTPIYAQELLLATLTEHLLRKYP
jgi:dienelactone hydrolase